jgi:predicted nuclease of predicted toxin-antitoxin system
MKLLLDENLPKRLKQDLLPHESSTVRDMGWSGKGNGELLRLMKMHGFDAMLSFDKDMEYQQNFVKYDLPVFVLDAHDNTYITLAPLMHRVLELLREPQVGPIVVR